MQVKSPKSRQNSEHLDTFRFDSTFRPDRVSHLCSAHLHYSYHISEDSRPVVMGGCALGKMQDIFFLCSFHRLFIFKKFIEVMGMTLVNRVMQVSGVQFCNTSSLSRIVCSPPKPISFHHHSFPFTLFYLPHPLSLWQSPHHCLYLSFFICLIPSAFSPSL